VHTIALLVIQPQPSVTLAKPTDLQLLNVVVLLDFMMMGKLVLVYV